MTNSRRKKSLVLALALVSVLGAGRFTNAQDPLPSWNDGATKKAIVDFVARATKDGGTDFVPVPERVATFDNDGTLWCEQPIYVQVQFAIDRVKELAPKHPDWKTTEPFKSILTDDRQALSTLSIQDFAKVAAVSHTGITVEKFHTIVKKWLATAEHPRFHRHYTDLVYQPMLELMKYPREPIQNLHRHRRRSGFCPRIRQPGLRRSAGASRRLGREDEIRI